MLGITRRYHENMWGLVRDTPAKRKARADRSVSLSLYHPPHALTGRRTGRGRSSQ